MLDKILSCEKVSKQLKIFQCIKTHIFIFLQFKFVTALHKSQVFWTPEDFLIFIAFILVWFRGQKWKCSIIILGSVIGWGSFLLFLLSYIVPKIELGLSASNAWMPINWTISLTANLNILVGLCRDHGVTTNMTIPKNLIICYFFLLRNFFTIFHYVMHNDLNTLA